LGLKRNENQDRTAALYVNSGGNLKQSFYCFVLCDGMGGMKNGSAAASVSVSTFIESLIVCRNDPPEQRLQISALAANDAVKKRNGGGSTLSAVLISENKIFSLNVGDSRIYSKSTNGVVKRHTKDDNLKEFAGGEDERLLQFIGMGDGLRPHINTLENDFDLLFLTSDGVHSLDTNVFDKLVQNSHSSTELCSRLVSTSVWTGGHDNASVIGVSKSITENLKPERQGPEIAVWNNSSEMQIVWADREQKKPLSGDNTLDAKPPVAEHQDPDFDLTENDDLGLEGGQDNRKTPPKNKNKTKNKEPKDSFGDFG
ncbi:MAG: PP2C family serine/threonine-protein phosphatase, partial [Ekhidna sp.]